MNAIFEAAKEVADFMAARKWKFCVIGGVAVQRWGEPRLTQDADLTLLTGLGEEEKFAEPLPPVPGTGLTQRASPSGRRGS